MALTFEKPFLIPLKLKYRQGGFDNGNHGKCTGNSTKKRVWKKGVPHPDIRGGRVRAFC